MFIHASVPRTSYNIGYVLLKFTKTSLHKKMLTVFVKRYLSCIISEVIMYHGMNVFLGDISVCCCSTAESSSE